jgi:hypothetical protein
MAQALEHLPVKHKALSSKLSTTSSHPTAPQQKKKEKGSYDKRKGEE